MGTWNIVNRRGGRLKQVAAGLGQMGMGVAVLMKKKFVDSRYPKMAAGFTIMSSKAACCAQGCVTLAWRKNNLRFEV
jgi:hypothetical protein